MRCEARGLIPPHPKALFMNEMNHEPLPLIISRFTIAYDVVVSTAFLCCGLERGRLRSTLTDYDGDYRVSYLQTLNSANQFFSAARRKRLLNVAFDLLLELSIFLSLGSRAELRGTFFSR
jgi:hypothetical protein